MNLDYQIGLLAIDDVPEIGGQIYFNNKFFGVVYKIFDSKEIWIISRGSIINPTTSEVIEIPRESDKIKTKIWDGKKEGLSWIFTVRYEQCISV